MGYQTAHHGPDADPAKYRTEDLGEKINIWLHFSDSSFLNMKRRRSFCSGTSVAVYSIAHIYVLYVIKLNEAHRTRD